MDNRKRLPTPATGAPVPGTLRLGDEAAGARCAKARQGAQPRGLGAPPHAKERPRRGPEAGGLFLFGPFGGLILVSPRAADAYRR